LRYFGPGEDSVEGGPRFRDASADSGLRGYALEASPRAADGEAALPGLLERVLAAHGCSRSRSRVAASRVDAAPWAPPSRVPVLMERDCEWSPAGRWRSADAGREEGREEGRDEGCAGGRDPEGEYPLFCGSAHGRCRSVELHSACVFM